MVTKRGNWSSKGNRHFKRCHECGSIALHGICQRDGCDSALIFIKAVLISKARRAHGDIRPLQSHQTGESGFMRDSKNLYFYFHDKFNSTHLLMERL